MKIWVVEARVPPDDWQFVWWEETRASARMEAEIRRRLHKTEEVRVRAYERVENSK